ncbi:GGDEF domain-containing protein [Vibrio salinus]|uniref:GGDEF domain-containing protein n=1 Tax=Vibrio salinus TaxID=2899784 RepID=UPI001E45F343|nr:GGDEF domain-containing protein [Vibrio salinus]MCE0494996.1 GGDEF domain-containing protein [Vibrio salinus]
MTDNVMSGISISARETKFMNNISSQVWLSKCTSFISGDFDQPTFHRVHHILLFVTFIFLLFSEVFNFYFLDISFIYQAMLAVLAMGQLFIWYFSRFKQRFKSMAILYVVIMAGIGLPASWFFNGGSQGPTLAFIYILVIYSVVILCEVKYLNGYTVLIMVLLPVIFYLGEYYFPASVSGYTNPEQRVADLIFCNVVSVLVLVTIMLTYTRTLKKEVQRANDYSRQLQIVSETDSLTSLKNRIYSVNALQLAKKANKPFNIILLDIDHFKNINDTYGHDVGDVVLKKISDILKNFSRFNGALVSRYGGEEFLVVTFFQTFEQTMRLAESLRIAVNGINYSLSEKVTISLGVAKSMDSEDYLTVIKRADRALYESKHRGRNQVSTIEEAV